MLKNEVERIFGCVKIRFPFINAPQKYLIKTQISIVYTLCSLYNFIRQDYAEHRKRDPVEVKLERLEGKRRLQELHNKDNEKPEEEDDYNEAVAPKIQLSREIISYLRTYIGKRIWRDAGKISGAIKRRKARREARRGENRGG